MMSLPGEPAYLASLGVGSEHIWARIKRFFQEKEGNLMARRCYHYAFDATKHRRFLREGRGRGEGKDFLPWVQVQEVLSRGFSSRIKGWKTGRNHHLLSNYYEPAYPDEAVWRAYIFSPLK